MSGTGEHHRGAQPLTDCQGLGPSGRDLDDVRQGLESGPGVPSQVHAVLLEQTHNLLGRDLTGAIDDEIFGVGSLSPVWPNAQRSTELGLAGRGLGIARDDDKLAHRGLSQELNEFEWLIGDQHALVVGQHTCESPDQRLRRVEHLSTPRMAE